ncbi:MAG TPA: hypothetical protein VEQ10_10445 [Vicinamibacteria bacterium]|nr:hypothetical protein [Vicinamibacteria bacterium]
MDRFAAARTVGVLLATFTFTAGWHTARADEILLKSGGRLSGVVVEKTDTTVSIECSPGRVTLPLSRVERISQAPSSLELWRARAAGLGPADVRGWASLARWADEHGLATQARESWQRVLALDAGHPEANAALGRVWLNGAWMSREDAWRAQGYVEFDGRWVTPAERAALLEEQRTEEAMELQRREAELRAREAEARAREAEARARQAEGGGTGEEGGIPLWWGGGYAGYPGYGAGYGQQGRRHDGEHQGDGHGSGHAGRPATVSAAPPSTPPSSIGTSATQPASGGSSGGGTGRPHPAPHAR